jgi:NAD(P)H-hydrate repair Nnr-like enzyme with NAD(P)H-hydrate epimerase domain
MNLFKRIPSYILTWIVVLVAVTTLMIIASPKLRSSAQQQQETKRVTVVPKVISKVKDLEVIGTTIKRQDEPSAVVAIDIRNNSDKPIIAIAIESGDEKDAAGVSTDGFKGGEEPPSIVLPAHGTITMEIAVSNLLPGKPLKIAGVMYADETEDGDELTRRTLRKHKEHAKAKGSVKKGEPPQ